MFSHTIRGAAASARLYPLVETARANGIEPHAYFSRLFERLPHLTTVEDYEAMLPWNLKPSSASIAPHAEVRQNAVT